MLKELIPLGNNFESVLNSGSAQDLACFRFKLEQAVSEIKEIKKHLDESLIKKMKDSGLEAVEIGDFKIFPAKRKTEKIKSVGKLIEMLTSENMAERNLSRAALSSGQSAWKIAQVKVLADTLGLDLVETKWEDKVEIKAINQYKGA